MPLWNLTVLDRTLRSYVRSVSTSVRSSRPVTYLPSLHLASGHSVRSLVQRPVLRPVTTVSSFLRDLAYGLVLIFMLGLCLIFWILLCS